MESKTLTFGQYSTEPYGILTVTETATSTPTNTSTVHIVLTLKRPYSISSGATKTASCTIDGTSYSWSGTVGGSGDKVLIDTTQTITHNTDGKKTISISAEINFGSIYWNYTQRNLGTKSGSTTMALTEIPRYPTVTQSVSSKTETTITMAWSADSTIDYVQYSINGGSSFVNVGSVNATSGSYTISGLASGTTYTIVTRLRRKDSQLSANSSSMSVSTYSYPYCTSTPNFTLGARVTIGIYNPLGRSVTIKIVGADNTERGSDQITGTSITGYNDSGWLSWWYSTIPNSKTGTYKVKVIYGSHTETKTGGTYTVNESACAPAIGSFTYKDTTEATTAITDNDQMIVQGKSSVEYTVTGLSAKYSASVASVSVSVNSQSYALTISGTSATGGNATINSGTNVTATATVTDSRGVTYSKQITVTMVAYSDPTAIIKLQRASNYYSETVLNVDARYTTIGSNQITISYKGRIAGTTPYTIQGTAQDGVDVNLTCDNQYAWEFSIVLTDSLNGSNTYTVILSKGMPLIFFDRLRNSIGLNRFPSGDYVADIHCMMQATGSSNTGTSISADTITQIPVTVPISVGDGFEISDGGIKVLHDGVYKVSGSAYLTGGASSGVNRKDVFIRVGTDFDTATEVASATDNVGTSDIQRHGSVGNTPKLIEASANDIIYLACRLRGGTGSYYAGNAGTFLLVERIR